MLYFTKLQNETVSIEQFVCNECGYVAKSAGQRNKYLKEHMLEYHPEKFLKYTHEMDTYSGKTLFLHTLPDNMH